MQGRPPLHYAIQEGNLESVNFLLDAGAGMEDIVAGAAALHCAVWCGRKDIVKELVKRGANVNLSNCEYWYVSCLPHTVT